MNLLFFLIGTSKVNAPFLLSQAQYFLNCQCGGVDFDLYPFSFLNCHCYILIDTTLLIIQAGLLQLMVDKIPDQFLMNTASWRFLVPRLYCEYPNDDMLLNISTVSPRSED